MSAITGEVVRCECQRERGRTAYDLAIALDEHEPTPQAHKAGECPGTYDPRRVEVEPGVWRWLCSWCW